MTHLFKEQEDIVDSEYFCERLFSDSEIFQKLFRKIIEKEDSLLIDLILILVEKTFKKEKKISSRKESASQDNCFESSCNLFEQSSFNQDKA